jgi:hypothetical protein
MSPHHHLVVVLALASLASLGEAFLPTQTSVANAQHRSRAPLGSLAMAAPAEGLHGTGSRFLPIQQLQNDDYFPRTIAIAGEYPGVTAAEILGLKSAAAPEVGQWQYDFTDPQGPQVRYGGIPPLPKVSYYLQHVLMGRTFRPHSDGHGRSSWRPSYIPVGRSYRANYY